MSRAASDYLGLSLVEANLVTAFEPYFCLESYD